MELLLYIYKSLVIVLFIIVMQCIQLILVNSKYCCLFTTEIYVDFDGMQPYIHV